MYKPREKRYNLYFGEREAKLLESLTFELMHDVVQQTIIYYSLDDRVRANIYGEVEHKIFRDPVEIYARVTISDADDKTNIHGIDREITMEAYIMREEALETLKFVPKIGDFVQFDEKFFEIYKTDDVKYRWGIEEAKFQIRLFGYLVRSGQFHPQNMPIKGGHSIVPPR
jgi:hypothetical protein